MAAQRRGSSSVALALGLTLTVFVTLLASLLVAQIHREAAEERAREIGERLSLQLVNAERELGAIAAHIATMDTLDPARFADFYDALSGRRMLSGPRAFVFMLPVRDDELALLERRIEIAGPAYASVDYPAMPDLSQAEPGEVHYPIVLVEPAGARERLFGFDLVRARMRRDTAERALATGGLALSDPVLLGQPATALPFTVMLVLPVSLSEALIRDLGMSVDAGLVAASIDPQPLLRSIVSRPNSGVDALMLSMTGAEGVSTVRREDVLPNQPRRLLRSSHSVVVGDIPLADRALTLMVEGSVGYNRFELFGLIAVIAFGAMSTLIAVLLTQRADRERALVESELARKRAALERAASSAQETQHLESLGRLVGGVAHDFNNLMTVILGNLEFLREEPLQSSRDGLVDEAIRATERGRALTAQLLAFGRRAQLDPKPVDLSAVLHDAGRSIGRILPDNVALTVEPPAGLWPVTVDRNQLDNAILNLVLNARDAMADGGTITLSAANLNFGGNGGNGATADLPPGRYVMLAVTDTGHGMEPATVNQAFEPFFTTKTVGEGSGLGLSMVFGFAKQSGGTARITSTLSVGTSVKLFFPVTAVAAPPTVPAPSAEGLAVTGVEYEPAPSSPSPSAQDLGSNQAMPAASGSFALHSDGAVLHAGDPRPSAAPDAYASTVAPVRRTIMVVEDDPAVRRLIAARLRGAGYSVSTAPNGDAALQIIEDEPDRHIDLLLTDIAMPGRLQGPDLARRLATLLPQTRIVFLSGYPREMTLSAHEDIAAFRVLSKPINGEDLLRAVAENLANPAL
ncbi:MAG: response regulator [Pseudomonadota bacterium]